MALLNYTTSIPAAKTVQEMHTLLAKAGVSAVASRYDGEGYTIGLSFELETPKGPLVFNLPVDIDGVQRVMSNMTNSSMSKAKLRSRAQAERVAWRIAKTWLEAQLALIQVEMATVEQIMLPYMMIGPGETVYDRYVSSGLVQITSG